jgi:hypothetical protein
MKIYALVTVWADLTIPLKLKIWAMGSFADVLPRSAVDSKLFSRPM